MNMEAGNVVGRCEAEAELQNFFAMSQRAVRMVSV